MFHHFLLLMILLSSSSLCGVHIPQDHEENVTKIAATINHDKEFVFGFSGNLSGHFKIYGTQIIQGITACFEKINKTGGIQGKKLRLVSINDYGDPQTSKKNMSLLLNKYHVDLFIGNMGTRSIKQALPLIKEGKIALFFPWGGDKEFRDPALGGIINGPGYLEPQIDKLVEFATTTLSLSKVGIFHADDHFSHQAARYLESQLTTKNTPPIKTVAYNRFTLDIAPKGNTLLEYDPNAILSVATSMPTTKLINHFFRKGHYGTVFLGIDSTLFVKDILINRISNYYFSSAVPDARKCDYQIAKDFRQDSMAIAPEEQFTELAFTYYIGASIIAEAMRHIEGPISKKLIIGEIEKMTNLDLKGFTVTFDKKTRHAFGNNVFIVTR